MGGRLSPEPSICHSVVSATVMDADSAVVAATCCSKESHLDDSEQAHVQ